MKQYKYKAKKNPNETVTGVIESVTRQAAIEKINEQGLFLTDLEEIKAESRPPEVKVPVKKERTESTGGKTWAARDLIYFYRQLARLLKAGVPILRALALLAEQTRKPALRRVLDQILTDVRQGKDFSAAAAQSQGAFPALDISLIQAGESVGKLQETMAELARYRQAETELFSKLRSALAYPLFVAGVGAATVGFMLGHVIPQFSKFFLDLGQALPLPTRILMAVSGSVQIWGLPAAAGAAVLVFLFKQSLRVEANRTAWHAFLLSLPLAGPLFIKAEIARIMRTLELLAAGGLPLLKSLRVTVPVCTNELFRKHLKACVQGVEEGKSLSECLKSFRYYPEMVIYLIQTGEETGGLHETLTEISEWYEGDVESAIATLTKFIEPVLILLIGLLLGAIVIALLLPVFSMNTAIN